MPPPREQLKPSKEIDLDHALLLEAIEDLGVQVCLIPILLHDIDLTVLRTI